MGSVDSLRLSGYRRLVALIGLGHGRLSPLLVPSANAASASAAPNHISGVACGSQSVIEAATAARKAMLDNKNVSHLISRTVSVALSPRIISSRVISEGTGIPPTTMETVVFLIYGNLVGPSLLRPGPSSCPYSPECVEGAFSEARGRGVLRNSRVRKQLRRSAGASDARGTHPGYVVVDAKAERGANAMAPSEPRTIVVTGATGLARRRRGSPLARGRLAGPRLDSGCRQESGLEP